MLKENTIQNQTVEDFREVLNTIVKTVQNIDLLSRQYCPEIDHFVLFSTLSSGRGNRGHENYGMAYSIIERICEQRAQKLLPGLAIQFGPIFGESQAVGSVVSL